MLAYLVKVPLAGHEECIQIDLVYSAKMEPEGDVQMCYCEWSSRPQDSLVPILLVLADELRHRRFAKANSSG